MPEDQAPFQWDDDNRPHGAPNPDDPSTRWNADLRAWVSGTAVASTLEPRRLTNDEIDEIEALFRGAVERDEQYPIVLCNTAEMDAKMLSFAYHNRPRMDMVWRNITVLMERRYAELGPPCPYDGPTRNAFRFSTWTSRAAQVRREVNRENNRADARARAQQNTSAPPRSGREVTRLSSDLTPEQMTQQNAMFLIAIGHLMEQRPGRIWYDEFLGKVMTDWDGSANDAPIKPRPLVTRHQLAIMRWLMSTDNALARLTPLTVRNAVSHIAFEDRRHCVREWLNGLPPWDGEERLAKLLPVGFATDDNEYTRRVGQNWLVAMVARVQDAPVKVDFMPVFYGKQGPAKTWALKIIASPEWYDDITDKADGKDFLMKLQGKWLLEIAEMHSIVSSRHDMAAVKALMTREVDRFRPPYGHEVEEYPRQMAFAGTTNLDDWHTDPTGGRRFNPVKCRGRLDLDWIRSNRDQLFAEAMVKKAAGWEWWEVPLEGHREALEEQQAVGPYDNTIAMNLAAGVANGTLHWDDGTASASLGAGVRARRVLPVAPTPPPWTGEPGSSQWGNLVTTERIAVQWIGESLGNVSRLQMAISTAMLRLGWRKAQTRLGNIRIRHWVSDDPSWYGVDAPAQGEMM